MKYNLLILLSVFTISGCTISNCRVVEFGEELAKEFLPVLESDGMEERSEGEAIVCSINDYVVISTGPNPSSIIVLQDKQPIFIGNEDNLSLFYDKESHSVNISDMNKDHNFDFLSFDAWDESLGVWVKLIDHGFDGQLDARAYETKEEGSKVQDWKDGKWQDRVTDSGSQSAPGG